MGRHYRSGLVYAKLLTELEKFVASAILPTFPEPLSGKFAFSQRTIFRVQLCIHNRPLELLSAVPPSRLGREWWNSKMPTCEGLTTPPRPHWAKGILPLASPKKSIPTHPAPLP